MNPKKVIRKVLPKQGIKAAEEAYRKGRVVALQARYGFPAKGLKVVAITGTNGKTTTANYVNAMLKSAGFRTALYSTAVIEMDGQSQLNRTHRTVPLTTELVAFFKQAKTTGVDYVIMEVTSQALDQHKLLGVPILVAVMTNLTQDHLDYHKSMEAYASAKARLFNDYLSPKYVVLNRDDSYYQYFRDQSVGQMTTYGQDNLSDAKISTIRLHANSSSWILKTNVETKLTTKLPGTFNIYNATAAACVGQLLGLEPNKVEQGIATLESVPGRMEVIDAGQHFAVLVDYAHTPDALQNVLQAARGIAAASKNDGGRVMVIFGATGDRDKTKRPIMGEIAASLADLVFLTDDETYSEDGATIRSEVRAGLQKVANTQTPAKRVKFSEIADRREAIRSAFAAARPGDIIILAGIGHQDTRNMGGKLITWDERQVARELLG